MKKLPANGQFLLDISSFASIHLRGRSFSQPTFDHCFDAACETQWSSSTRQTNI